MVRLAASSHANSRLRILRIVRRGDRHDPRDLTVAIRFEGDFAPAFLDGRTEGIIPPGTLRTFVREAAQTHGSGELETIGLSLCERVLDANRQIARARVELTEHPWVRLAVGGKPQGQAFTRGGPERRTTVVTSNRSQAAVVSGIEQLALMRTSGLLPRTARRRADNGTEDAVPALLTGSLDVRWSYGAPDGAFGPCRQGVRAAILDTFALHAARSVQYTLFAIAEVALATYPEILDVALTFREHPCDPAELFRTEGEEPEDLFIPSEEPVRTVEVVVERDQDSD